MEKQIIDNLKKFGAEFQYKCLASVVSDRPFLERIVDILSPDYFETDAHKWIVEQASAYFLKYKEVPTMNVFKIKVDGIENEILKKSVIDHLIIIYKHCTDKDLDFVKEQFLEFCKNQKLKSAILQSVDFLENGEYEQIKHVVDEALRAGVERDLGHDYIVDVDKRMSEMARTCVKTSWAPIDTLLDGGLGKGELGFFVAPAGSGKSWLLARLGAEAMRQGKNVLHFTMELNQNYVGLRYDACFTGIAFQDVRKNIDIVKNKIKDIPGKLKIKYFPIKTVSPYTLKMHIDKVQLIDGIKIDLVIVDYADILRPFMSDRNSNSYTEAGNVYEELRAVAGELQIPIWSASQSNRSAHEEDVIQAHNVADSYRKIMTGDFVVSLSRKMEDKLQSTGRLHVIKNRFGQDGMTFPIMFDTGNGNVQVFERDSAEGVELLTKMKNSENVMKDSLKNKWNNFIGEGNSSD